MERFFNTAGRCDPERHYMLPPESRLPEAPRLIGRMSYFIVHAPRQTGKSTTLSALARALYADGRFAALYFSCEGAKIAVDGVGAAENLILTEIELEASIQLDPVDRPPPRREAEVGSRLRSNLMAWARACRKPLALFFDEIDALRGDSLLSVLSQLRAGHGSRPKDFPASVVLCGLRDVRDYKIASGVGAPQAGSSSPFNIKVASLRIGDFTNADVRTLYGQHTTDTGQPFTEAALERAWALSQGQPWLTNALADKVTLAVPVPEPITATDVEAAKEAIILERQTHLDSLLARLNEQAVRDVVEPLIAGRHIDGGACDEELGYVRDLGLIAVDEPTRIANPIYREIIVRVLASKVQGSVTDEPRSFVLPDGRLDFERLLREFVAFWIEHGDVLVNGLVYHEVAPQLVLMAYMQRIVNGGGYIDREYGVGRGRIDLLVRWPYREEGERRWQREALELKVRTDGQPDPLPKGLVQLDAYLAGLGLDTGVLVLFDRRPTAPSIAERSRFEPGTTPSGREITVLRL